LPKIGFEVDKLVIAHIMQLRGTRDFGISMERWNRFFRGVYNEKDKLLVDGINEGLDEEYVDAGRLKEIVEKEWRRHEKNVLAWLKELTKVNFKEPTVKVCVVPFAAVKLHLRIFLWL